ncbi:hypothetical protein [Bradyrhizobium sp.]|uniref:hypothetical protein n=1 Tax=Bradyrhizobium sp. TaxID=376 RepID=UPI003C70523E
MSRLRRAGQDQRQFALDDRTIDRCQLSALITGRATQPDQRLKIEFRLWNVAKGQQRLGEQYFTQPEQ